MEIKNRNIICFAGEDWWYHNPHSNLHIMKSFAKENRVLFVNSIGVRAPNFKKDKFVWKKIRNKLKSLLRYLKKAEKNIYVLTPLALPLLRNHEASIQRLNKFLLLFQLRIILFFLKFEAPVLWVCTPSFADVALALRKRISKCLVYYCVDNISFYAGEMNPYILQQEIKLHSRADLAFFVNHQLVKERKQYNPNTHHLGHGVDYEHYAMLENASSAVPDDLKAIPGPIVGYIGVMRGLDFELVKYLAQKNKELSFVFIGDVQEDLSGAASLPNVHFLGKKPYESLPLYMSHIACFGIFYFAEDVFNNYRNPKKLLEYLATGKPVVSVPILEMEYFKELVYIARGYEEFDRLLKQAVYSDPPALRKARRQYAKENTWDDVSRKAGLPILEILRK